MSENAENILTHFGGCAALESGSKYTTPASFFKFDVHFHSKFDEFQR